MGDRQTTIISIDWKKAEEEPNRRFKVQGQFLLDLRIKCEYLKDKLESAEANIINLTTGNHSLTRKLENSQATNKKNIEEKEGIVKGLELEIANLKSKLARNNYRINELSDLLKQKESEISEVSTTSDQKILNMTSELNTAYNKISALENAVNSIKNEITSKTVEIGELSLLTKELKDVKDKLNLELIEKTKSLAQKNFNINELKKELDKKSSEIETQSKRVQDLELELEELKPPDIGSLTYSYDTRINCPSCGAVGKHIKKVDDKKKVLSHIGSIPMYAKKYICKNCTYEWI